jgi:hypothetical protein
LPLLQFYIQFPYFILQLQLFTCTMASRITLIALVVVALLAAEAQGELVDALDPNDNYPLKRGWL